MKRDLRRAVLLMALVVAALAAGSVAIRSYDFGWHVRAGLDILNSGQPPRQDSLTFTSGGAPWVDHEWLFQVLLAATVRAWGVGGVWLLKLLLVVLALLPAAWMLCRRGHQTMAVAGLAVIALEGARFRFFARPEMAGLVFLPLLLALLVGARDALRRSRSPWPFLIPLPLMIVVWVNMHPSALLGAGLLAVSAVALLLEERHVVRAWPFLATAALSLPLLAANPYGSDVLLVPLSIGRVLVSDQLSNPEWGTSLQPVFWMFWVVLVLLGALVLAAVRRRRLPPLTMLASGLALAALAAGSLRFLGFFYVALPVLVLGSMPRPEPERRQHWSPVAVAAPVLCLLAAAWFLLSPAGGPVAPGLAAGRFPEAMARSYQQSGIPGPLFNPVRYGGYLAWVLAPEKVFIDGRNELHGPLLAEMADCRGRGDIVCWDALLARWGVTAAILPYEARRLRVALPDGRQVERSARAVYFRRQNWALIDWDDTAMLLVRRQELPQVSGNFPEDRWLRPDEPERLAEDLRAGRLDATEAWDAVQRHRRRHPDSRRGALAEAIIQGILENRAAATAPGND